MARKYIAALALLLTTGTSLTAQQQPATSFLNHRALLNHTEDADWYLRNIPFLEVPDTAIQQVYYYRWQTYKEHLIYTTPQVQWLSTEFLSPASYGAAYGGINAAAGHHITEGRWLWNTEYVKSDINYWLRGPGQSAKPQDEEHNRDTADWAHEYSFWAASSIWQWYLATGDRAFVTSLLPQLAKQYEGWSNHFDRALGLYWQVPVWDATEYTAASLESSDPYHGGAGFRPTINAYQFGDAKAIASIARLANDNTTASLYTQRATALQNATIQHLWDPSRQFFFHMARDNNPAHTLLDTREEQGFVPWMFELPKPEQSSAMAQLLDPQGFNTSYGPPTTEKRSHWYMQDATHCCHWNGPSWPYETSQTLTGLANLLIDYPKQQAISNNDYIALLHTYAATQYRNDEPYIAEAHAPEEDRWIYDSQKHSEDYNHSTYIDNVIAGLIGLRGQPDNTLVIAPLAPASWDYFALEHVPYHGHSITVLWDKKGTRYHQGKGLSIWVDKRKVATQADLKPRRINVGATVKPKLAPEDKYFDVAANNAHTATGPRPIASYTSSTDNIWNGIDGIVYRTGIPQNSRWTNFKSPNSQDFYGVDFQHNVTLNGVRLVFFDNSGDTRTPASFTIQYWNGSDWATASTEKAPQPNTAVYYPFKQAIKTTKLRILGPSTNETAWGISELYALSATADEE